MIFNAPIHYGWEQINKKGDDAMRMRNCFVTIELSGNTVTPPYSEDFIFQIPDCFRERKEIENYSMNALRENERNLGFARML